MTLFSTTQRSFLLILLVSGLLLTIWIGLLQATNASAQSGAGDGIVLLLLEVETSDIRVPYMRGATAEQLRRVQIDLAQHRAMTTLPDTAVVYHQYESFPYTVVSIASDQVDQLSGVAGIKAVFPNHTFFPQLDTSTLAIRANQAWDIGYEGAGQTVVVLDTGVYGGHEFFGGRLVDEACFSNGMGIPTTTTSLCPNGQPIQLGVGSSNPTSTLCGIGSNGHCNHGTHVAGIAVGRNGLSIRDEVLNGVAPAADLIGIQVFSLMTNTAVTAYGVDLLQALDYVYTTLQYSHTIAAVNMSLGSGAYTDQAICDSDYAYLKAPIDALRDNGIVTILASGNNGYTDALNGPACISSAVAIGASVNDLGISSISNSDEMVDLLAPGHDVNSSVILAVWPYIRFQGTSMSAPHIAGAWALAREMSPTISVTDALNIFIDTGLPISDTRAGGQHIKPLIQIDAAMTQLVPPPQMSIDQTAISQTLGINQLATQTIQISNTGGLPLVWQASACDDPLPDWLAISSTETITTLRNTSATLDFVFDTTNQGEGMVETAVCLQNNGESPIVVTTTLNIINPEIVMAISVDPKQIYTTTTALTYTIHLSNSAPITALNLQLRSELPTDYSQFVWASDGGVSSAEAVTWPDTNVGPGEKITRSVAVIFSTSHQIDDIVTLHAQATISNSDGEPEFITLVSVLPQIRSLYLPFVTHD